MFNRLVTLMCAGEAVAVVYLGLSMFFTANSETNFQVVPALALLFIAVPLVWHVGDSVWNAVHSGSGLPAIIVPNIALLGLCLAGSLPFGPSTSGLPNALLALTALAMIGTSSQLVRARGRSVHPSAASL